MESRIVWIFPLIVWEGTATMIRSEGPTTWDTSSLTVRESGKGVSGRNREFLRSDWICCASEAVRANILTGMFLRAMVIASAVPHVVVPITATDASKSRLLLGLCYLARRIAWLALKG
jgi:hypothetical protein